MDLPYLNTIVEARRGDIYLIRSPEVYHTVINEMGEDRQGLVLTNHKGVMQRFVDVEIPAKITNALKWFATNL